MSRPVRPLVLSLGFALLASILASAGCGKKSSTTPQPAAEPAGSVEPATPAPPAEPAVKPTPSDAELNALFARTVEFLGQFAAAIFLQSCSLFATAMTAVFDAHKDVLAEAKSYEGNTEVDAKADAYMKEHSPQVEAAVGKMMTGMQACAEDPDVQKAMEQFDAM